MHVTSLLAGSVLLAVVLLTFARELGAPADLAWGAGAAYILYMLLLWRRLNWSARGLLLVALGLGVFGVLGGRLTVADLRDPLGTTAFMAALFTCFGTLREAASSSSLVRRCGWFLASRPAGQRYGALMSGAHLFGLILNFSAIPLLGTLVLEGTRDADTSNDRDRALRAALRRRQMAQAIHRGFTTTVIWCPLTISMAVIFAALPDTSWKKTLPWLLALVVAFMLTGWGLDRLFGGGRSKGTSPPDDEEDRGGSWGLLLTILFMVSLVFALGFGVEEVLDVRLVIGVMMACPLFAVGWLFAQKSPVRGLRGALGDVGARCASHVRLSIPAYCNELGIIGASTLIALVVGALLPPSWVPSALAWLNFPSWVVFALIPWLAVALGQVGMSPLLSIALIAATMPSPAVLGVSPELMAVSYAGGWALTSGTSPFTAALLISSKVGSSRTLPISPVRFGLVGNGPYTVICLLILNALIALMGLAFSP